MHPAVSTSQIEYHVRTGQYPGPQRSILLVFSSFSGETSGDNYEFLRRIPNYHYHSGHNTACYCVGYSVYDATDNDDFGLGFNINNDLGILNYFYPKLFEDTRSRIQTALNQKWQYNGGVDLLLFAANSSSSQPVVWNHAAVVQSKKLVPRVFGDVEAMVRTVLNLNRAYPVDT